MRPLARAIALAVGLAASSACSLPFLAEDELPLVRLSRERRSFTAYSGLVWSERLVVRDPAAWTTVWNRIWAGTGQAPPLPEIDFFRDIVVVAALGEQPSNGYEIRVESAVAKGETVTVSVRSVVGCRRLAVMTQPVDIARVARREGTIRFREIHERESCPVGPVIDSLPSPTDWY